jgi:hypothetical protein
LLDLVGSLEAFQVASGFGGSRASRAHMNARWFRSGRPLKTADGVDTESVRWLGRNSIDTLIVPGARHGGEPGVRESGHRTVLESITDPVEQQPML